MNLGKQELMINKQDNEILYKSIFFSNFMENFKFVISSGVDPTKDFDYLRKVYSVCLSYDKRELIEESFLRELLDNKHLFQYQEDLLRVLYKLRHEEGHRYNYGRAQFLQTLLFRLIIKILIVNPDNVRKINNAVLYLKEFTPANTDSFKDALTDNEVNDFLGLIIQTIDYSRRICETITFLKILDDIKLEYMRNAVKFFVQLFNYYKFLPKYDALSDFKISQQKRIYELYYGTLAELSYSLLYKIDEGKIDSQYMDIIAVLINKSNCFYTFEDDENLCWYNYDDISGGAQCLSDFNFYKYRLIWSYFLFSSKYVVDIEKTMNNLSSIVGLYNLNQLKNDYEKIKSELFSLNIKTIRRYCNYTSESIVFFKTHFIELMDKRLEGGNND